MSTPHELTEKRSETTPSSEPITVALTPEARQEVQRAQTALDRGETASAITSLEAAHQLCPDDADILIALGNLRFQLGQFPACFDTLKKAARLRGNDPLVQVLLATAAIRSDHVAEFETAISHALEIDDSFAPAHRLLADLNLEAGRFADAARGYGLLISQNPDDVAVLLALGKCLTEERQIDAAEACLVRVLELDPTNHLARENLNVLRRRLRDPDVCNPVAAPSDPNLEMIACPFCESHTAEPVRQSADIVRCGDCHVVYLRTRSKKEVMERLYQSYADEGSHMALPKSLEDADRSCLKRDYFLKEILQFTKAEGSLLDVGCGWGAFLLNARQRGFAVSGLEITRKSAGYANETLKIPVKTSQFLETNYAPGSQTVVTMLHVFEHLPYPKQALEKVFQILKPGGMFCGIVPNFNSFCSHALNEQWYWLDPNYHYVHYTPATLRKHLEAAGFIVENIYTETGDYGAEPIKKLLALEDPVSASPSVFDERLKQIENEGCGEEIRFFARKPAQQATADLADSRPALLTLSRIKTERTSLRPEFLRDLARLFEITTFIETGTFMGETAASAATVIPEVHTIELSPELARKAIERFSGQPQVHVHAGDSARLLPQILATVHGPTLLWLDGHYSEGETARGDSNTPILQELRAVKKSGLKDAILLIDDLRLFQKPACDVEDASSLHGYPTLQEVHQAVLEIDSNYQFLVLGDVALAFPNRGLLEASPMVMAMTVSRLYDGKNLSLEEVFDAENVLVRAEGEELEAIRALHRDHSATERYGLGLHYRLWHALTLIHEKKFLEAHDQFAFVAKSGFNHWRPHWYRAIALFGAGQHAPVVEILDQLIQALPRFAPAQQLRAQIQIAPAQRTPPGLAPHSDPLPSLQAAQVWHPGQPLRLHLGCGENHFDGYVNIDYPPSEHSVQTKVGADVFADITSLNFPSQSVDEIRLHHVFEHFTRPQAMALLIRWHEWLKPGGKLHIETPDIMGCVEQLASNDSYRRKQAVLRHCFGSHEAHWANHYDGWHAEKYQNILSRLGFAVECRRWRWPHEPYLANVDAYGTKKRHLSRDELLAAADSVLEESMVAEVASERAMWNVWRTEMRKLLPENSSGEIVVKLQGGLGNQMFQYAAGLALARRTGARLKLDLSFLQDRTPRPNFTPRSYCLDLFNLAKDCEVVPNAAEAAKRLRCHTEQQYHFDPAFHQLGPNVYLDGYFQSARFFEPVSEEVRQTFMSFVAPLNSEQQALADKIASCPAVCLNVRRGDYVSNPVTNAFHGVCDESYFQQAVAFIRQRVPNAHFFIFSDDIEWCRAARLTGDAPFTLVSHDFAGDRFGAYLRLMTACRHFILPNSSFGWWAAFLSDSPDKIVLVPEPWFDDPTNNTTDLLPSAWIRLPKNAGSGPKISVIISCHNYARYLPEAVASVLNQTFRNFEIILIDDGSSDDSLAVAQRLMAENQAKVPFRVFHLDDSGPSAARRFGAMQARGQYLLPLDADDRIAPNYLAKTVPLMEADSKLGFVYVDTVFFGDVEQRHHQSDYDFSRLCRENFISYCSLIRKAAFDDVGGYDPENWGYYEDWDLWIRLGTKCWFGRHLGEPLFFYRHHFNSSLSLFAGRLDPIYKAFVYSRRPKLYPETVITSARQTLAEMPPAWHSQPPMRNPERLKALLAQHPGNRHVLYFLGCTLAKQGAVTEARTALEELLKLHPNDIQARDALKQLPASSPSTPMSSGQTPFVSVIVPTYNRPDWLGETLQSILAQTYRNFEIVVVNDAGPDVSHIIAPLNTDGRIQLITHEKNKGLAGARNTGIRAARGQYIAYLDDDDIYYPQHLATLVAHAKTSGAAVVYSDAQRATQRKDGDRYVVVERTVPYSQDWDAEKILIHNFIPVLCFLHKKQCVEEAGWFDESLTTHEDWDLWMRMSRRSSFSHIKEITCEFRWRDDGSSMSSERRTDFVRTADIIYQKHPELVKYRPDLQARRQQFLLELSGPMISSSGKPAPGRLPVSIIIPVFNKVEFTKKCLARLAAIPCAVPHEIIVVDDHSSDGTEAFCLAQVQVQSNLRYHRLPENRGFGRACNHGAAQARGHWLVFLNNDTEPEPGWLEAAMARFESDPTIGIVGAKLLYPDRTVQHCGIEFFWADNFDHNIWPLHRHPGVAEQDPKANAPGQMVAVTGACLSIPSDLFHSLGGFSPEYPMYFEDTDLCFKAWQAGRKVFYEPKSVVIHHESQSSPNRARVDALNKESGEIFFKKWAVQLDRIAFDTCVEKSEGRFSYFRQQVLPMPPSGRVEAKWLEGVGKTLIKLFHHAGPFYMHFGGAGDALLLLATFLDKHPDAQVISFANSIPAMRSFFEAFPSLKRVWFLPKNTLPQVHIILRRIMRHCPNCLGVGTTPEGDYFKDWHAGLDIFQEYKVNRHPEWPRQFQTHLLSKQVVLAPRGSLCGMVGTKRNIIDPAVWPQLIRFIQKNGYQPVIIGTPDESKDYPCPTDCEDRRSYSFREQMEHIANSAMLIGADSWAKTFSALAGVPTIVFEPIKGADWTNRKDPSDFVFLDPWEAITVVKDFEQCRKAFTSIAIGQQPAKAIKPAAPTSRGISWEGSFLDYGSLSHINRELTARISRDVELTCVGPKVLPKNIKADSVMQHCAKTLASKSPANTAITVRHQWPPNWSKPASGKLVIIQPWEYGALPKAWVAAAKNVDEFWVPSPLVRAMYLDSGIASEKVRVVPNGVDTKKFRPGGATLKLNTRKKFKFLFVGGTIFRKGPDILLEAFSNVFTAADDVCLVIKDFGGDSFYQGQTAEVAIRAIQQKPNAPEILYLKDELSSEQMPSLYAACDCLVLPYRGEGFGMPVLEAMACGKPVIVTDGGATDSFVSAEAGWKIPSQGLRLADHVGDIELVKNGWLLEPSRMHLSELMRYAAGHPDECRKRGAAGRAIVEKTFDWNHIAASVVHRLGELAEYNVTEPAKPAKVVAESNRSPQVAKPVAANLPVCAELGNLSKAREAFGRKNFSEACSATIAAIQRRPFHPEGFLLLAEIALAAGDANSARLCAQRARDLASGFKTAKQFLQKPLKGNTKPQWLIPDHISRSTNHTPRLTVCVITKNEEKFIAQCLKSVRGLAQQIVVVDTGSTDRTVEIAKAHGAEVHNFTWCDDFSAARNAALEHATGDWILMLDADEELPADQHTNLLKDIQKADAIAYRLPLANEGKDDGRSFVPRLFRNAPGVHYYGRIHEQVFPSLIPFCKSWGMETRLGTAQLLHHGYTKELVKDRNKIERNLRLLKQANAERPDDANLVMNLGLELVRSDELSLGLEKYDEAFQLMSAQAPTEVVPELREVLLTQFTAHLYKAREHDKIIGLLNSPLAKNGGLTASLHFALGLANFEKKNFRAAAEQMRQCVSKKTQPALSPINTDILTAAPHHCLALSLAEIGDVAGAENAFQSALKEKGQLEGVMLDHARFLAQQNRPVDAFHKLHEIVAKNPSNTVAWTLGGAIALKHSEFLEFACDWTGEAIRALPNETAIIAQRAEALLLSQQTSHAHPLWERACNCVRPPNALAALILCSAVESHPIPATRDATEETATSQAFVGWYQRLLHAGAEKTVLSLNSKIDVLRGSLPTAARLLDSALAEAK